ncbi:MAG: hypothetical protein R3B48_30470 [Kofleriaceae bacterium]
MQRRKMAALGLLILGGCAFLGGDDNNEPGGPLGGALAVEGTLVDFQTGQAVDSGGTLTSSGLIPERSVISAGAAFSLKDIPENSTFQLLVSAPPTYRATLSPSITVVSDSLRDVKLPVVSEASFGQLISGFGVTATATRGVLLAQVVDDTGAPRAGVSRTAFQLAGDLNLAGPYFLGADLTPTPAATATSASGWVVYFEVKPGLAALTQAATATVTLTMPDALINPGAVTIAKVQLTNGVIPMLTNVSFSGQVQPIFAARGCIACHSGNKPGNDLGNLSLNEGTPKLYRELTQEVLTRVRPGMPELSLLLTMPSREVPADRHPNVTFASAADPDFQKIYVWIKEGAKNN